MRFMPYVSGREYVSLLDLMTPWHPLSLNTTDMVSNNKDILEIGSDIIANYPRSLFISLEWSMCLVDLRLVEEVYCLVRSAVFWRSRPRLKTS